MNTRRLAGIATVMLAFAMGGAQAYESTVFYTVGHQDDWQLFMSPNAYNDAQNPNVKTVFLYMTAGNAQWGNGPTEAGREDYYRARDIGALAAMRFVATRDGEYRAPEGWRLVFANGHLLSRWQFNNAVAYFFHLPDGRPSGDGFSRDGLQSLRKLQTGEIVSITDIHGRITYHGWGDLAATVRSIVVAEATGSSNVWVNVPFPVADQGDGSVSATEDHSDHIYSGRLMLEAVKDFSCVNAALFFGYQTGHRPSNLNENQLIIAAATWGATNAGLLETDGARNTFGPGHNKWVAKRYFDTIPGTGDCDFSGPSLVVFPGIVNGRRPLLPPGNIPGFDIRRLIPGPIEPPE